MPKPMKGESQDAFIARCHRELRREGVTDSDERNGKCFGIWRHAKGESKLERKHEH